LHQMKRVHHKGFNADFAQVGTGEAAHIAVGRVWQESRQSQYPTANVQRVHNLPNCFLRGRSKMRMNSALRLLICRITSSTDPR